MIRASVLFVAFLIVGSSVACESPISPRELRALNAAQARWAARPFQDYSVEMRESCFCPPVMNDWVRIEVMGGSIARVIVVASGAEVSASEGAYFRTVDGLFDAIRAARDDSWVKDVVVEYDPQLGFPTYVSFVPKPGILDGGGSVYLRSVAALPAP